MKKIIIFLGVCILSFMLIGCTNTLMEEPVVPPPTISTEEEQESSEEQEPSEEQESTKIQLTKNNLDMYLNITINQIAQSQTLLYNTYLVVYEIGNESEFYDGLTPPTSKDVKSCIYINSTYSVLTTFSVNATSKNNNHSFFNANFSLVYRSSPTQFSAVAVNLSSKGSGSQTFMMIEEVNSPNKVYSLYAQDLIGEVSGEVCV